jgi:hypothetical protein
MKKYLLSLTFLLGTILVFSQRVPPPPATPQSGGPGAPASPIDDYIIYLAIVGLFVIYYTYKKSNRLVKINQKNSQEIVSFFIFIL